MLKLTLNTDRKENLIVYDHDEYTACTTHNALQLALQPSSLLFIKNSLPTLHIVRRWCLVQVLGFGTMLTCAKRIHVTITLRQCFTSGPSEIGP